jgi:predicted amidophosphoribosyltransferase
MSLILDLIFPKTCFGCGKTGFYFCPKCRKNFNIHSLKFSSHLPKEGSLSLFYYHGLVRSAIQSLKYEFVTDLADEFSNIFSQEIIKKYPDLLAYWQKIILFLLQFLFSFPAKIGVVLTNPNF